MTIRMKCTEWWVAKVISYIKFYLVDMKRPIEDIGEYLESIMQSLVDENLITIINQGSVEAYPGLLDAIDENQFVYEVKLHCSPSAIFYVHYSFDTFTSSNRLSVELLSDNYLLEISSQTSVLEVFKVRLSRKLLKNGTHCVWLHDKESQQFATDLYPFIHETENLVRQFINEVMINSRGINWWQIVPKPITNKLGKAPRAGDASSTKQKEYKSVAPSFKHVEDNLMLLDIADLKKIMELKHVKLETINSNKVNDILNGYENPKEDSYDTLIGELKSASTVDLDIWDECFSQYLSDNFLHNFSKFDSNRNHVAHNKLLDYQAYLSIKESTAIIHSAVTEAFELFRAQNLSEEEQAVQNQQQEFQQQQEEDYLNSTIESDTDLTLHSTASICRMFQEKWMEFYNDIEGEYGLRADLDISAFSEPDDLDAENEIFSITHKVKDEQIKFSCVFDITEGWGSTSSMEMILRHNEVVEKYRITFTNGDYEYNSEQTTYMPTSDEAFDNSSFIDATHNFIEYLDENFEDMMEVANMHSYVAVKDGGNPATTEDICCCECGEFSICVDGNIAEFGQCLKCGAMNEIAACERCGSYTEKSSYLGEDNPQLCDGCSDYYRNQ